MNLNTFLKLSFDSQEDIFNQLAFSKRHRERWRQAAAESFEGTRVLDSIEVPVAVKLLNHMIESVLWGIHDFTLQGLQSFHQTGPRTVLMYVTPFEFSFHLKCDVDLSNLTELPDEITRVEIKEYEVEHVMRRYSVEDAELFLSRLSM